MRSIIITTLGVIVASSFSHAQAEERDPAPVNSDLVGEVELNVEVNGVRETHFLPVFGGIQMNGKVVQERESWFGILSEELPKEIAVKLAVEKGTGLIVREVMEGSPALKAGLLENDVIVKLDNMPVASRSQLQKILREKKVGDTMEVTCLRDGKKREVAVTLAARPDGGAGSEPVTFTINTDLLRGEVSIFGSVAGGENRPQEDASNARPNPAPAKEIREK